MGEVFLDAFLDALKLLPFLLLLYILIELLEHKTAVGAPSRALAGKWAPLLGAATGLVPLCGFSVMASKLYERRHLTIGTLFAVFISTSDEAILVLALSSLAPMEKFLSIVILLGAKLLLGTGVGYLIDLFALRRTPSVAPYHPHHHHDGEDGEKEPTVCEHRHESKWTLYLFSPLLHALEVAAVIFAFNVAFGALFYGIGEERVLGFLQGTAYWYQPLMTALVGLIPNCASSVVLAEVYAAGGIGLGSLLGGLVTNAGFGVLILFRTAKAWKRNLAILFAMLLLGILFGYAAGALEFLIK